MALFSSSYMLKIGGFGIKLWSKSASQIVLDEGYTQFIAFGSELESCIEIEVIPSIPIDLRNEELLVFETNDTEKKLWHVCKFQTGYKVIVFSPLPPFEVQQIAIIEPEFNQWKIYAEPGEDNTIMPLSYPMGPLIMYYITAVNNAIMVHSSGVIDGEKGRLFSGFSGVGKSTMAGIWQQAGHTMINDDRLMLTIENDTVIMHNTPMFYDDKPKKHTLNAIYLLKQTKENCIVKLNGVEAMTRFFAFCIQHAYDKQFMEHHLSTIFDIYSTIPIYELGFKPDSEIIDFIRLHD